MLLIFKLAFSQLEGATLFIDLMNKYEYDVSAAVEEMFQNPKYDNLKISKKTFSNMIDYLIKHFSRIQETFKISGTSLYEVLFNNRVFNFLYREVSTNKDFYLPKKINLSEMLPNNFISTVDQSSETMPLDVLRNYNEKFALKNKEYVIDYLYDNLNKMLLENSYLSMLQKRKYYENLINRNRDMGVANKAQFARFASMAKNVLSLYLKGTI